MDGNYKCYNLDTEEETLILEQIKYLHGEFVSIQQFFVGITSVALVGYAIVIYYAIISEKEEFFLFLPFLFSLSVCNILKYTIRVLGLDAYIRHLEKLINFKHKKSLFLWQSYLVYANGASVFGAFPQSLCFLAIGIFLFYRFRRAVSLTTYPRHYIILLIILLIVQVMLLALMGVNCLTQYWVVLDICKTISPTLMSKEDIQKLTKIKPQKLCYAKLFSLFISRIRTSKKKELSKKNKKNNNKSKSS